MVTAAEIIGLLACLPPEDMPKIVAAAAARWAQKQPVMPPPEVKSADDESLTIEEAAALLRRSTKWIYRHRAHLPFVRKIGPRSYLVSKAGLLRWCNRQHG
jgi:hypothetical protein